MRILYDGSVYTMRPVGGVSRYFLNLINRLPETFTPVLLARRSSEIVYPIHSNVKRHEYRGFRPGRISQRLEKYYFRICAAAHRPDLAHPTYYSLLTQRKVENYRCPVVITVHDMIHEIFRAQLDPTGYYAEEKRGAIMAAQAIICVSENTRKDLLERYPSVEDKVTVIYHASELSPGLSYGTEPIPVRPYFLYAGGRASYKNFDGLLMAFAKAVSVYPDSVLCVVGSPFSEKEKQIITDLGLVDNVELYGQVTDPHLAKLYRCSVAFVYPSLYEGFGIPLLEAMSCGAAVVASQRSSIPEVVGDAALLFDPSSPDDLTDILLALLTTSTIRDDFIARGRKRAQSFSWDQAVGRTLDVYRSVI